MKLKPCPFCGGEAAIKTDGVGEFIECATCHVCIFGSFYTRKQKINRWNTRHYPPEVQRAVERMKAKKVIIDDDYVTKKYLCPQCKTGLYSTLDKYCPCCSQALDWEE